MMRLAGAAPVVVVAVLAAELAGETARADRLERDLDQTRRDLAICQIERLLEGEGYVDCDREPVL